MKRDEITTTANVPIFHPQRVPLKKHRKKRKKKLGLPDIVVRTTEIEDMLDRVVEGENPTRLVDDLCSNHKP